MRQSEAIKRDVTQRFGAFLTDQINPGTIARDQEARPFSRDQLREIGKMGLFGYAMPKHVGGDGHDAFSWGVALEQVGYLCDDSRAVAYHALNLLAEGMVDPTWEPSISVAKYFVTERAIQLGQTALHLLGGRGYLTEQGYERNVRDLLGMIPGAGIGARIGFDTRPKINSTAEIMIEIHWT